MSVKLRFIITITYKNGLELKHQYSKKQGAIMNARLLHKRAPEGTLARVVVTDRRTGAVIHTVTE